MEHISLLQSFENETLQAEHFGHKQHIIVAHMMLQKYDGITAIYRFAQGIKSLTKKAGADDKFNATITVAMMSIIAERMNKIKDQHVDDFLAENHDLYESNPLKNHFTTERLNSNLARETFLLPDLWINP